MEPGSIITSAGTIDQGPSAFLARIGSPSPTDPSAVQYVNSSGTQWFSTLREAAKSAVKTIIGPGAVASAAVSKSAEGIAAGAKAAGAGIQKAATSTASGLKIGAIIVVVLIGIVLIAQVRGALKA